MQVCKCGQENEDSTYWCRACSRKLYRYVDKSKQISMRQFINELEDDKESCKVCQGVGQEVELISGEVLTCGNCNGSGVEPK